MESAAERQVFPIYYRGYALYLPEHHYPFWRVRVTEQNGTSIVGFALGVTQNRAIEKAYLLVDAKEAGKDWTAFTKPPG